MATKDELRAKLDELGAEQPPADAKKEELEAAVAAAEGSDYNFKEASETGDEEGGAVERGDAVAVDEEAAESNVVSEEESQELFDERMDEVEEKAGPEHAELVEEPLDESGPLLVGSPDKRIMTGAVSEEHAAEQEELLADKPEGYVGEFTESGEPAGPVDDPETKPIDPATVINTLDRDEDGNVVGASNGRDSYFGQKSVFYTDGLSGAADSNLERAYDVPEQLQSNDPEVRKAGDESESEAAQENKTDEEKALAEEAKTRDD